MPTTLPHRGVVLYRSANTRCTAQFVYAVKSSVSMHQICCLVGVWGILLGPSINMLHLRAELEYFRLRTRSDFVIDIRSMAVHLIIDAIGLDLGKRIR